MIAIFRMSMRVLPAVIACLFLAACGTKGPLVLPPKPAPVTAPPQQPDGGTTQPDHSKAKPGAGP